MSDINREVLISHINDLRALEVAKAKLQSRINSNNTRANRLGFYANIPNSKIKSPAATAVITFFIVTIFSALYYLSTFRRKLSMQIENIDFIAAMVIIAFSLFCALIAFLISISGNKSREKEINRLVQADRSRVSAELNEKNKLFAENKKYQAKVDEINGLLSETYSLNIIPQQYRNVNGICYLYDYLSTSNESLESAFMNYNLNVINQNINRVAEYQYDMILQQYETNARLESMDKHNQVIINQLSNIEANTAQTAEYAAITAAHAKANTFFEAYKFFDKKN